MEPVRISEGPIKLLLRGDARDLWAISRELRYRPKGFFYSPKFQAYKLTDGAEGWDGYISPLQINERQGMASCMRGHKDAIIRAARNLDLAVDLRECLTSPFQAITSDDVPADIIVGSYHLDEFQRESVAHWLRNGMGVNKIAVNGGKTAMFAAACAMLKQRFGDEARVLYITQTERLVRQSYKDMRGFLPDLDITQFGGSKKNNTGKDMVISTAAMLWKNVKQLVNEHWFESFMAVFYDESHHVFSDTSSKLMNLMVCFFRFGASDTKKKEDPGPYHQIRGLLGPIRYTVPVGTYIDMGRSAKPTIYVVEEPAWYDRFKHLPYRAEPGSVAWALVGNQWRKATYVGPVYERDKDGEIKMRKKRELDRENVDEVEEETRRGAMRIVTKARWIDTEVPITVDGFHTLKFEGEKENYEVQSSYCLLERVNDSGLVRFKERNEMIVKWARFYSEKRAFPTLIVCTRTLHIYILESLLKSVVDPDSVRILFGDDTSKERDRTFEWLKRTPGGILISPLVKEGVSIPEIRGGVIADYVGNWETGNQIIGRFIRKKQTDNNAHITWFYDNQHQILRDGCVEVISRLKDVRGYEFVYPVTTPETATNGKVYKDLS